MRFALLLPALLLLAAPAAAIEAVLPPALPWSGPSEELQLPADHPWATPAERDDLATSPVYEEALAWLDRLVDHSPQLVRVDLGESPEGRPLVLYIASKEGLPDAAALRETGRPLVLAHGGIHSGEIDGLDAGMMLLRDMLVRGVDRELLERANFAFLPVFNVDGHARRGPYGRVNQRGPEELGWRSNARNLNLNRDYAKAETTEMQLLLGALREYQPSLYLDLHVTDGADYQYDITYGFNGPHAWSPAIGGWLQDRLAPALNRELGEMGHTPGPLVFAVDGRNPRNGIYGWTASPRFSHGYGDAAHIPSVLLENHSLKPYRQRVLGTRVFLAACLRVAGGAAGPLREAIAADRARRVDPVPLTFRIPGGDPGTGLAWLGIEDGRQRGGDATAPPRMEFLGVSHEEFLSPVSGRLEIRWTGEPVVFEAPVLAMTATAITVPRPAAYWIPAAWAHLGELLDRHGIAYERTTADRSLRAREAVLDGARPEPMPFEGRMRVAVDSLEWRTVDADLRPGSLRVPTDQPLGGLAILLLEPHSPDSFFQWGYMLELLTRTEYIADYVIEPTAQRMMQADPALRASFEAAVRAGGEFAGDGDARLHWFYERSPWIDARYQVYPVLREEME